MTARLARLARYLIANLRAEEQTALLVGWPGLPACACACAYRRTGH